MPPHLLLTYDFPPMGGGIARLMGHLAKGYPAGELIVSTGQHADSQRVDQLLPNRIDRLPLDSRRLRTVQGLLRWSRRVSTLARDHHAEFIWCGNVKPATYPARWAHERIGTPYGVMVYGMDLLLIQHQAHRSRLKRRAARLLLEAASVIVAISRWTQELCVALLRELHIEPGPDLVRVVPLGADPDSFRPGVGTDGIRSRYRLESGRWILTVARLAQHKGIDTGLRALAALRETAPELRYAIVGAGDGQAELERLAAQLHVADRVRFLTEVPDDDLPAFYNLAEIYLGVSRPVETQVEGFGLALVEASACGIPVIGGRNGGIPEAVREGETGLLVDAEDPREVVAAIRTLLDDHALAARLGAGGRRAVEQYYNWPRVLTDLRRIAGEFTIQAPARQAAR